MLFATLILAIQDPGDLLLSAVGMLWMVGEAFCALALTMACSVFLRTPLRAGICGLLLFGAFHVLPFLGLGTGFLLFYPERMATGASLGRILLFPAIGALVLLGSLGLLAFSVVRKRAGLQGVALAGLALPLLGFLAAVRIGEKALFEVISDEIGSVVGLFWSGSGWQLTEIAEFLILGTVTAGFAGICIWYACRCFDPSTGRST